MFKSYKDDLIENGFIKPATREIYKELSEKLEMTSKAINVAIVRHSEEIFGVKYTNKKIERKPNEDDELEDEIWSCDSWITILLNDDEMKLFDSQEKKYSDRNRRIPQKNWANDLSAIIVRETETECCINFVRGDICGNEIEANGYCSECKGTITVKSFDSHRMLRVKLDAGSETHTFTKKRRITHDRKKLFEEKLKTSYPSNVLNELANEMPLLSHESRDIPSDSTLKAIRHKVLNKSMLDPNSINALRKMKYLPQFGGAIKEIGTDPLRVIFWTEYQLMWYKNYAAHERSTVSIDATGRLVSSTNLLSGLGLDNIKLPHIFLYLIVAKTSESVSVPIGQYLSADQSSLSISYFLQLWQSEFKKKPREIVLDDSAALLKSCVLSFTSCGSVKEYFQKCFMVLNGHKEEIPSTYIRLDISHFSKTLKLQNVFKSVDFRVRRFYLCCIGVMIKCESFDDIKNIVRNVLIVANNPSEGTLLSGNVLPTHKSITDLNKLIRTHDINFISNDNAETHDLDSNSVEVHDLLQPESEFEDQISTPNWIDEILSDIIDDLKSNENSSELDASNSAINFFYLPELNDYLRQLCGRLPLWSAVMQPHFNSPNNLASSSNVESTFNRIKNIMMENIRLPVRIDLFMEKYLASVNGSTKLAISKYPKKLAEEKPMVRRSSKFQLQLLN